MSAALFDSISRIARHEASARAIAGIGRVTDIFPSDGALPDHAVTIEMRDSGLILPRVSIAVGAMGFAAIPAVDDLVLVVFAEGDFNAPVVVGRLYHPDQEPPEHAEDEIVLRLPSGAPEPKFDLVVAGKAPSLILKLPGDTEIDVLEEKVLIKAGAMQVSVDRSGRRTGRSRGGRLEAHAQEGRRCDADGCGQAEARRQRGRDLRLGQGQDRRSRR